MYSRRSSKRQNSGNIRPFIVCAMASLGALLLAACTGPKFETFGTSQAQGARNYWQNLEAAHYSKTERRKMMPPEKCTLCSNKMVWASSIEDTAMLASKNLEMQAGASNPTPLAFAAATVCTNCWHSYNPVWGRSERSTQTPGDFEPALHPSIAEFPVANLPLQSAPIYKQSVISSFRKQEIFFWIADEEPALQQVKNWSAQNNLLLELEKGRQKKSVFIRATHFNPRHK